MNRIAMVTGASRGIGRACALELAKAGVKVALAARQVEKLEAVAGEIRAAGGEAFAGFTRVRMARERAIRENITQALTKIGELSL